MAETSIVTHAYNTSIWKVEGGSQELRGSSYMMSSRVHEILSQINKINKMKLMLDILPIIYKVKLLIQ